MSETKIDLVDLKAKAQAAVKIWCRVDALHSAITAYQNASDPKTILTLIGALEELEEWRNDLLESAVTCEDAGGFMNSLINEAKLEGITMDGRTLVAAD